MGITGLWPILEPCCRPVTLESLEGKKLAVDVSIWIYQAQLGYSSETKAPHIALLINRLSKLLFYKIKPVFVFDGPNVPIFKMKVLDERRLKKFDEDILLNKGKRKYLEDLAKGNQNEKEVKKKLRSPQKRILYGADAMFNLPSTSAQEVTLSDDDDDLAILKCVDNGLMSKTSEIERLVDFREQIRQSRLHPEMIPTKTEDFCQFQLARVLGRNKIDKTIAKLTKEHQNFVAGADIRLAVADSRGGTHVISYEGGDEIQAVDPEPSATIEAEWNSLGLTLEHFQPSTFFPEANEDGKEIDESEMAEMASREFLSKSSMIEKLMLRRIGVNKTETLRQDDWSSDLDDEDFIDVSDSDVNLIGKVDNIIKTEKIETNREWSPENSNTASTSQPFQRSNYFPHIPEGMERDPGAYRDLQEFLTACGFPWIEAPGEAEAQCVELERLGLVEGIVSDDSDVWAFGAQNVYRHLFSKNKNVQYYSQEKIFNLTSLTQPNVVEIAMLSGGDYSQGIHGVGIVTAIELLAEFSSKRCIGEERKEIISTISAIEEWIFSKSLSEPTPIRRKIRALVEKNNELEQLRGIANPEIVDAYLRPNVDSSREPLRWRKVNIEGLRVVVRDKLCWQDDKFDKLALPSFQKWNDFIMGVTSYQKHITSYALAQSADEQKLTMTKRVAEALTRLAKKMNPAPLSLICQTTCLDAGTVVKKKGVKKTITKRSTRRAKCEASKIAVPSKLILSESSSDSDF